jgi:hypothetical protein
MFSRRPVAVVFVVTAAGIGALRTGAATDTLTAGQACQAPPFEISSDPNIFSEEQENHLGDAVAERLARDFRVIEEPELTAPLAAIGDRLMKHMPPSRLRLQFHLIELPEVNAFVLPGGRIYVSRKMVSFAASEDELAGVIAHELGHLVTRQQTITISRQFRNVLNVTSVGDRADIFEKYHRLLDNAARNPNAFRQSGGHESRDQIAADRTGIFMLAAAGYDPAAYANMYDRFAETKGKTGGFFSDLFGTTSPEARRLREVIKSTATVPASCVEPKISTGADYQRWQTAVVGFAARAPKEALRGVLSRTRLEPPLRGDTTHLRFSPDGRFILAQDDSGITILTRAPLAPVFRIHAPEARNAQFTPDSGNIVFHTSDLRVERWTLTGRKLDTVHEVVVRTSCVQTLLAPDGRTLACADADFGLSLVDVASGAVVFQKKQFYEPDVLMLLNTLFGSMVSEEPDDEPSFVTLGFSTDARYFAAGFRRETNAYLQIGGQEVSLIYDLQAKAPIVPKGTARKFIATGFTFTGPDRLIAINPGNVTKSGIVALPAGEVVQEVGVFGSSLSAATKGNFLFARPMQKYLVGVLDVSKGVGTKGLITPAIDIYDDVFIAERGTGALGLYSMTDNQLRAEVALPPSTLGRVRASAVSPDLKWLAVSERSRGGVWNLTDGRRAIFMRGFRGASVDAAGRVAVDVPRFREEPRQILQVDAARAQALGAAKLGDDRTSQVGGLLFVRTPDKRGGEAAGFLFEVRDARTPGTLWSRKFGADSPERLAMDPATDRVAFIWSAATAAVRNEVRKDSTLRQQLDALKEIEGDSIVQVFEGRTGKQIGTTFIETGKGSFRVVDMASDGDWLAVEDTQDRTRIYSLSTGEMKGRVFGTDAVVHGGRSLVAVRNSSGRLSVHDTATLALREEFTFSWPVAFAAFGADGTRLLVLTTDHTAFVLDLKTTPGVVGSRR